GMFSSVQTGVRCLAPSGLPFFVLPVDCPCVQPTTLLTLLAAYEEGGDAVVRPVYGGQRGHPPLLSSSLKKGIMEYHG
ncbi:MAG: NTP transferase domain-containing protein, partial [Syntrophales bacterium]|nr:NTP transferase domain-containing protein [Syntrophales bacterium]